VVRFACNQGQTYQRCALGGGLRGKGLFKAAAEIVSYR